jgi:hypothetical protein
MSQARLVLAALALCLTLVSVPMAAAAEQKLTAFDGLPATGLGQSVDVDGITAVVGAPAANGGTGAAFVYVLSGGTWTQTARLIASDGEAGDTFGVSVAVDGDVIAVGAENNEGRGAVYLFYRNESTDGWTESWQKLRPNRWTGEPLRFGHAVALDGGRLAIGEPSTAGSSTAGGVSVYDYAGGQYWSTGASLTAWWSEGGDQFGTSVSLSGDTLAVGAIRGTWQNDYRGEAHVYSFAASDCCTTGYPNQQRLWITPGAPGDGFGAAVATDGDTLVIGAPGADSGEGAAYVATRSGSTWSDSVELTAEHGGDFGTSVGVSGNTIIVGAPGAGAAHLFTGAGGSWTQTATETASDGTPEAGVGSSLAIGPHGILAGAPGSGAAYAFSSAPSEDTTAPETTVTAFEPTPTTDMSADFEFVASEAATFQCSIDGDVWIGCRSPLASYNIPYGPHELRVRAIDAAGNVDPTPASSTWFVDAVGPEVTIAGPYRRTVTSSTFTLTGTASDPSTVQSVTWTSTTGLSGTANGTAAWSADAIPLAAGENVFTVTAVDGLGNVASGMAVITRSTTAPRVSINSPTNATSFATKNTTATLAGQAFSGGQGVASVTWRTDAGASGTATGTTSWSAPSIPLSPDRTVVTVTATDNLGNSSFDIVTINRDTTAPTIQITEPESTLVYDGTWLTGTAADENGIREVRWSTSDGRSGGTYGPGTYWETSSISVGAGPLTITVTATDNAGNTASDTITVTGDHADPTLRVTTPATDTVTTSAATVSIAGTAADNHGVKAVTWWSTSGASGTADGQESWSVDSIPLNPTWATYVVVTVEDLVGRKRDTTITFYRDTTAPRIAITSPSSADSFATNASTIAVGGTMSDDYTVASVAWSANGSSGTATATGTTTWNIPAVALVAGANTVTLTATDRAGHTATDTIIIVRDNTAPTVAITSPTSDGTLTTTASSVTLGGTAGDDVGLAGVYWHESHLSVFTATGTTSWSMKPIPLSEGVNVLTVYARDTAGNYGDATITVTRDSTPPQTAFSSSEPATTADPTGDFELGSSETSSTFQCSLDGAPFAACTSPYTTPPLADGPHELAVRATDAAGNSDATPVTHSWTVLTKVPKSTGGPMLSGTKQVGSTLTSTSGSWSPAADSISYRWMRCLELDCTPITDSADAIDGDNTYTLKSADARRAIYVVLTAINVAGSGTAKSNRTIPIGAPTSTSLPRLSAIAESGRVLTATSGFWSPAADRYDYRWTRCATITNGACSTIAGTADADDGNSTYTPTDADNGHTLYVTVTATNANGSSSAKSGRTRAVGAPRSTAGPTLSGKKQVGEVLTATTGSWTPAADGYDYRWTRCTTGGTCTAIAGTLDADDGDSTYTLTAAETNRTVFVTVTASNANGSTAANSSRTVPVGIPAGTQSPVISGTPQTGQLLTATSGAWNPAGDTYAYRWQRCSTTTCTTIAGTPDADDGDSTYTPVAADAGLTLRVAVTAANAAGSTTAYSARTPVIDAPRSTGGPMLSGKREVGSTLTSTSGSWNPTPDTITYRWTRCLTTCSTIAGTPDADDGDSTYTLTAADLGHTVYVTLTATNSVGTGAAKSSKTAAIAAAP